ncbi:MAG: 3-hydroxyacyl-ACP dehydratase [Pseudomonadota bacterium]|nr:3-hydroxyacyl-ACP dehydratase [Pseudomonadota bacterium]
MSVPPTAGGDGANTVARIRIGADHPGFVGHFPGQPILPGVALLAEVMEAALVRPALHDAIGAEPRIGAVKFLAPVAPSTTLDIVFALDATALHWHVVDGARRVASGDFSRAGSVAS